MIPVKGRSPANMKFLEKIIDFDSKPKSEMLMDIYQNDTLIGGKIVEKKVLEMLCSNPCQSYFHSSDDMHKHEKDHDDDDEDHDEEDH